MMAHCDEDARMLRLLDAVERLPGLVPFASCSGHTDPMLTHAEGNGFFVEIHAEGSPRGMESLGRLAWVAAQFAASMDDPGAVTVSVWTGELGDLPVFSLEGRHGADPDALADALQAALPLQFERRLRVL